MPIRVASFLFFCIVSISRPAMAEKATILAPHADAAIDAQLVELTLWLIADWFKERDVERIMPDEAAAQMPQNVKPCREESCALVYLQNVSGADCAIVTTLFAREGGSEVKEIKVTMISRDGQKFEQAWPVAEAIEFSVDAALTQVYTAFLRSQSEMSAARETRVKVEETEPSNGAIQPKPESARNANNAPADLYDEFPETKTSIWNYIIGGSLLAGSMPLIIPPIIMAINDGKCSQKDDFYEPEKSGHCVIYFFGPQSIVLLSLGTVVAATGSFFLIFAPITVKAELSVGDGQAAIRFRGGF
jgi:hypothetical protein